ncbi:MAG: transporter permease [Pseudonocardia sp.]|nr:transporter permease [Pseudonocardia sp.]
MGSFLHYLSMPYLLQGIMVTLQASALGFFGGFLAGTLLAGMALSRNRMIAGAARTYSVIFRGTPLVLQLVFVFTALPHAGIVLSPILAAGVALAANEATFFAEILRSSVRGVDRGQTDAARALGLRPRRVLAHIVGPQAGRAAIPAIGGEAVSTLKNSALASIIAVPELTLRSNQLASATFDYFSIFFASGVMYLLLTGAIAGVQLMVERAVDLDRLKHGGAAGPVDAAPGPGEVPAVPAPAPAPIRPTRVALTVTGACKAFGEQQVLRGVDLELHEGEVVALLGPSGSGKSTLLRLINHLETLDAGTVSFDGLRVGYSDSGGPLAERVTAQQRVDAGVGMVFQHFNLFAHLTARENVAASPRWVQGVPREQALREADRLLGRVGLAARAHALPRHLSGGQRQRVGIARALAGRPRVLLLDEPTSALDPELVQEVLEVIRSLAVDEGLTMLIATHQLRFAREVADRVVFMADGVILEHGPAAQVLDNPRNPVAARFLRAVHTMEV